MTNTPTTEDSLLVKLAAILRQAEDPGATEEERDTAQRMAQRLATSTGLDLAMARSYIPRHERRETPIQKKVQLSEHGKMGNNTLCELFMEIGRANDLKFLIDRYSTYVIAFGFPSDIEVTEALYASIVIQMVEASNAYLREGTYKTEKQYRLGTMTDSWGGKYKDYGYFPVSGRTARISFQAAYARRIGARLWEARKAEITAKEEAEKAEMERIREEHNEQRFQALLASQEARQAESDEPLDFSEEDEEFFASLGLSDEEEPTEGHSVALVLAAKSDEVHQAHKEYMKANRIRGSWKGGSSGGHSGSREAGRSAANSARLSAQKGIGGSRGALPR